MDRRSALTAFTGIAAIGLARTALAQTSVPAAGGTAQVTVLGSGAYQTQTLMIGTLSKQTSQLALTRATHPRVVEFAQFEVAEQTAVAQVLTDMTNPPPAPLGAPQQAALTQLQAAQGKVFDVTYITTQIAGHEALMAIQQDFLNGTPTNRDQEHIAVLARTVIQMHLTMLQDLQKVVGTA